MAKDVIPFRGGNEGAALRSPPHNLDAERALLGAILMNNRAYERVADFLTSDHFADTLNGGIFDVCRKLIDKGQQANPITLKTYFEADDMMIAAGGIRYLANLASHAVTIINAADYGRLIYDLYLRRELIAVGTDMVNHAFDSAPEDSALDQIEVATGELTNLMGQQQDQSAVMFEDAVQGAMERWQHHDSGQIAGLSTGLVDLDRELGLLEDGDLVVLAGAPGSGKTSLAFTLAYNAAKEFKRIAAETGTKPKRVVVFSAEMSAQELASRAMTTATSIQGPRRRRDALDTNDWNRLIKFREEITGLPLVIDARGGPSLTYLRSKCRQEQRKGEIGLIVMDFLQIMSPDPGQRHDGRTDEVGYNARGLKVLARDIHAPLLALSSINRKVEDRDNKRPHMADLRNSGDIEFAADFVAFCYRDEYYLEQSEPPLSDIVAFNKWSVKMGAARNVAEVIVAKSRHGATGTAKLHFDRTRTLFSDISEQDSESPPLSAYEQGQLI